MRESRGKTGKRHSRRWPRIILMIVGLIVLVMALVWLKIGPGIKSAIADGYSYSNRLDKQDFYPKNSTTIFDVNNKILKKLSSSDVDYTKSKNINPLIKKGLVDVEDSRFYIHHGIDMYAIMRSLGSRILEGRVQGGSTLTQQLVKNVVLKDQSQTVSRKLKEMVISQEIEKRFSKKDILEFYINDVYMGHANYGFSSAAKYYFSKNQNDLNLQQVALLIGIPNNPVYYDPVVYPQRTIKRRNMVLSIMNREGLISKSDYLSARKKPLGLKINKHTFDNDISSNYAINYAVYNATEDLMRSSGFNMKYQFANEEQMKKYDREYSLAFDKAQGQLLSGGYNIKTTIDPTVQSTVESKISSVFDNQTKKDSDGKSQPQVSSTVIDNQTGDVVAVVGGRGTKNDQLNRAVSGYRQPGSAAKPIVAYAPAFERGYLPQSSVTDSPVAHISNWYSGFTGQTTIRHALANSINTVAYKLAQEDTNKTYYSDLAKMEFARLSPEDKRPLIAIGGFKYGTTTNEMASAYSSFSRNGNFVHPSNVVSVYDDSNERMIYQNRHLSKKIYTTNASYMTINIMQSVISDGLGKAASLDNYKYTAGKTGSTDDNKDAYFVGMTPNFTIATWVGNDHPSTLTPAQRNLPMAVFKSVGQYMVDTTHEKDTDFKKPSTVKVSGDNLSIQENKRDKSIQEIIDMDFATFKNNQEKKNRQRLFNLDYRIVYHLSKKEEFKRDAKVKQAIKKYKQKPITKESQYESKLDELQKIRYLNINVKRQSAKSKFTDDILKLQKDLNLQQAMFEAEKDNKQLSKFSSERRRIEAERKAQRQKMVDKLMPEYNQQVQKVKEAYKNNDSDKKQQKQTLIDLMNEIRSYGGDAPDLKLEIDN